MRVTMRRPTGLSAYFSLLRSGSVGAIALAMTLSCSESMSVPKGLQDGVISTEIVVPDSLKQALAAQYPATLLNAPSSMTANILVPPVVAGTTLAACTSGAGSAVGYTESKVPLAPESAPSIVPYPIYDDGMLEHVPVGFSFNFYGAAYTEVTIYSNGLLMFGPAVRDPLGFYRGDMIPYYTNPNNTIAFAWTDWSPQRVSGGIRYETRGTAPNRRFLVQFTNVPEYSANGLRPGLLMSQVVLSEGSNDITIYTSSMTITNTSQRVTQGIENLLGTEAKYDSVQNAVTGVWSPRVKGYFNLSNDAIRFSLASAKDTVKPSITAPSNITVGNDPGLATAVVAVGSPVATDNCPGFQVSSVRSDGLAIDAPYHVGVTTITWTATDASGNKASAVQTVTVKDIEPPKLTVPADFSVNATSPSGAVVTFALIATDNVGVTSLTCDHNSGSTLPIGYTTITCVASDAAGNTTSKTFGVEVIGAQEQMGDLIQYVLSLGLPNGTTNPLVNQLQSAARDGTAPQACTKMNDFIGLVSVKGRDIPRVNSMYMNSTAKRICNVMGCV
jgi:HYR domain